MENLILIVLIAALCSTVLNVFFKRFNMPPILGYILSGVIITSIFNLQNSNRQMLSEIAEFGIVFLLFTIGLEFSVQNLKKMKKEVFVHGTIQFLLTSLVFFLIAHYFFSIPLKGAIVSGAALALSSTAIVLKFFQENREMGRAYARESLGILILQDIAVIPVLIMIGIFTKTGDVNIGTLLARTVLEAAIVLALLWVFGKYVLNIALSWVTSVHSHEIFISSILLLVVGASYLAHSFGFSYSLGAFIAGLMIAETQYKYQIEADLTPFRDILLGVFFVSVGMQIDIRFMFLHLADILTLMTMIMLIKAALIFLVLRFSHWSSTSLKTAVALSQVGEFSFVIFELAQDGKLLSGDISKTMIIAVVFSLMLTPFILRYLELIIRFTRRQSNTQESVLIEPKPEKMKGHILVCGYGFQGRQVVEQLIKMNIPYLAIEFQRQLVDKGKAAGRNIMFGNASQKSILKKAGLRNAIAAIVAIEDEKKAALVGRRVTEAAANINVVIKVSHENLFADLKDMDGVHIINEHAALAKTLVNYAITCDIDQNQSQ
ncbi:MAG: cation:proton antiporter [Leptospirales bacterium]